MAEQKWDNRKFSGSPSDVLINGAPDFDDPTPARDNTDPFENVTSTPTRTESRTSIPRQAPSSPSDALAHDEALGKGQEDEAKG
ncbi:MAG: hypothetical protein WCF30_03990 [Terracidiphilus sp.]